MEQLPFVGGRLRDRSDGSRGRDGDEAMSNGAPDKPKIHPDHAVRTEMARRTRRSFLVGAAAAVAGYGAWRWVSGDPMADNLPHVLRQGEKFNAALFRKLLGVRAHAPTYPASDAAASARVNGDIGINTAQDPGAWRLALTGLAAPAAYRQSVADVNAWDYDLGTRDAQEGSDGGSSSAPPEDAKGAAPVDGGSTTVRVNGDADDDTPSTPEPGVLLTLNEVRSLPRVEYTSQFKCIEGWSQTVHWAGARFADLAARFAPPRGTRYVGLETPGGDYYVGLEMADALHPQTLLCYEMNGVPLSPEHGAPLRLVIPIKYGVKHLKQIGLVRFTNTRPKDYWAEQGYDWSLGL
jgi:hypothetical protein